MEKTAEKRTSQFQVNPEDLMGIPFLWRGEDPAIGLDCFGLVQYLRGIYGIKQEFPKVVYNYLALVGPQSEFHSNELVILLDTHAQRVSSAQHMDIVLLEVGDDFVLGTVLDLGGVLHIAYMGRNGSNIKPMARVVNSLHGAWRYGAQ